MSTARQCVRYLRALTEILSGLFRKLEFYYYYGEDLYCAEALVSEAVRRPHNDLCAFGSGTAPRTHSLPDAPLSQSCPFCRFAATLDAHHTWRRQAFCPKRPSVPNAADSERPAF